MFETHAAAAGWTADEQEIDEVLAWFARYDELIAAGDLEAMADVAAFPLNEVTDDPEGHGLARPCDRATFIRQMQEAGVGSGGTTTTSVRHPVFLSAALCFVVTDASFTTDGHTEQMRYGDLLIRTEHGWRFQTMVAGGWHQQM